jgi:thioredoxin-like negative regulator of GroEL
MGLEPLTAESIDAQISGNEVVAIHFWAPEVEACKAYEPLLEAAFGDRPGVLLAACNADEEQEVAGLFKIKALPTLVVFREQVLVFGQEGVLSAEQLEDLVGQVQALDMDQLKQRVARQEATLPVRS